MGMIRACIQKQRSFSGERDPRNSYTILINTEGGSMRATIRPTSIMLTKARRLSVSNVAKGHIGA